jgi:hypothetical protein
LRQINSADNKNVKIDGYSISELSVVLGLPYRTVQKRLERAGIEPITTGAIYPKSALETIKDSPGKGRPKKPALSETPKKPRKSPK